MSQIRKYHGGSFKFKVALDAATGNYSTVEMCNKYGVAATQISQWKQLLLKNGSIVFKTKEASNDYEKKIAELERSLGKITAENHFLARVLSH